jgi:hypothetical protein
VTILTKYELYAYLKLLIVFLLIFSIFIYDKDYISALNSLLKSEMSLVEASVNCKVKNYNGEILVFRNTSFSSKEWEQDSLCKIAGDVVDYSYNESKKQMAKYCDPADKFAEKFGGYDSLKNKLYDVNSNLFPYINSCSKRESRQKIISDLINDISIYSVGSIEYDNKKCLGYIKEEKISRILEPSIQIVVLYGKLIKVKMMDIKNKDESMLYSLIGFSECSFINVANNSKTYHPVDRPNSRALGEFIVEQYKYSGELPIKWVYEGTEYPFLHEAMIEQKN